MVSVASAAFRTSTPLNETSINLNGTRSLINSNTVRLKPLSLIIPLVSVNVFARKMFAIAKTSPVDILATSLSKTFMTIVKKAVHASIQRRQNGRKFLILAHVNPNHGALILNSKTIARTCIRKQTKLKTAIVTKSAARMLPRDIPTVILFLREPDDISLFIVMLTNIRLDTGSVNRTQQLNDLKAWMTVVRLPLSMMSAYRISTIIYIVSISWTRIAISGFGSRFNMYNVALNCLIISGHQIHEEALERLIVFTYRQYLDTLALGALEDP